MKKLILLLILSISLFAGRYNIDESIFTNNNWAKPLHRTLITSTNYDYASQAYINNNGRTHGAVDIVANFNESVYSIAMGEVVGIYRRDDSSTYNMSVIYVKYEASDNTQFIVIYGHTYAKNGLQVGDTVWKDEYIGNIRRYANPDHLHFGITTDLDYHSRSFGTIVSGIVNPLNFLSEHINGYAIEVYDFWIRDPNIPIYTNGNFDAQFKLRNNGTENIHYDAVAMAIHNPDGSFNMDMMRENNVNIPAGGVFESGYIEVDNMPSVAGNYTVRVKVKKDGTWIDLSSQNITIVSGGTPPPTVTPPPTDGGSDTTWTTGAYGNNANMSHTLSISGANSLTVNIAGATEQGYDYITIYDENGQQVGRFSGAINETLNVNGSSIRAVLTSDGSVTRSGVTVSISSGGTPPPTVTPPPTDGGSDTTWTTGAYGNNANMSHTLSISGANSLTVNIAGATEQGYDYITIYDENGQQVGRFSGAINETLNVNGSSIRAVLTSDGSVTRSGVTVSISSGGTPPPTVTPPPTDDGSDTTWTTGAYGNNANMSHTLSISGASSLTVNIAGATEQGYDYITIYDENGQQVGRFSGAINETLNVNGSSIRAVLTSDGSVTRSGVTVSISSGGTPPPTVTPPPTSGGSDTIWTTGAYGNNANMSQTLSISAASSLTVTITGATEQGYDFITIYDENGQQVGRFSGAINETLTVNGSSIRAVLTSDSSITESGVTVSISSGGSTSSGHTIISNEATWATGAYSNNANMSHTLSISGASSLTVTITGATEQGYDFITIYDENGQQVGRFSGAIDETLTVNGSTIYAVLTSDSSITESGVTVSIGGWL